MALSESQRVTLAAHITANQDPDVVAALAIRNDTEITRIYNLDSAFTVWRESVQPAEYHLALVWTEVDSLQVGKARIWEWLTQSMTAPIDATQINVRQGLADVFPANQATRDQMLAVVKELATTGESIYAAGTGSVASPGTRDFIGKLTTTDVGLALNEAA